MLCVWFIALVLAHVMCMVHCTGSGTCYVYGSLHWFWHKVCVRFIALVLAYVMCMVHSIGSGTCYVYGSLHWF